jgi:parallel beta-helix repeat protein
MARYVTLLFALVALVLGHAGADVLQVPGDYATIQGAIDAASPGDIVVVAAGTYYEEIDLAAGVVVMGAGEGASIIDGGGDQGDVVRAIGNDITSATRFQGFTVTGANYAGMPGGGGIFCNTGASPEICNVRIEGNSTGIATWNGAAPYVHNNVIINNTYTGVSISSKPTVINNTIATNNTGISDSGGYRPPIMNNIITGNTSYGISCVNASVPTDLSYNDVWDNGQNYRNCSPGTGDISVDPLYEDELNGDYHLQGGSQCIDAGNPAAAYNDPDGSRNDMGAYGGPGAEVSWPVVVLGIPSPNKLNVTRDADVSAIFNVNMDASTLTLASFRLDGSLAGLYPGVVSYDSLLKMVTLDPTSDYRCGEVLTATLTKSVATPAADSLAGYTWQFTTLTDGGTGVYASPAGYYPTGQSPNEVVAGDFNADGHLDLATANTAAHNVSVLIGTGDGTFGSAVNYAVAMSPYGLCAAELSNDGALDLAVASGNASSISVLLGNGDGTFSVGGQYAVGTLPFAVCHGDFDLDGNVDLATANWGSGSVSVLLGDGSGTFGSATHYPLPTSADDLCAGDLDNDGVLDLAVANVSSHAVTVLLGDGDGGFAPGSGFSAGNSPQAVCTGDLNADGDLDILVANSGAGTVSVLLGDGSGSFGSPSGYAAGSLPAGVCLGDLDGDGDLDAVSANAASDNVTVLLGNGDGTFGVGASYQSGWEPHSVVPGDLDGDGDLDLCAANFGASTLSILLNEDGLEVVTTVPAQNGLDVSGSADVSATFNMDVNPSTLSPTTFKVHGALSGLHLGTVSYDGLTYTASLDPTATFLDGEAVTAILTNTIQAASGVGFGGFAWDFTTEVSALTGGIFGSSQDYGTGLEPRAIYAGDLDGDADVDLAVSGNVGLVSVFLNDGDGTFSGPSNVGVSQEPIAFYGADLDSDCDVDLAVINNRPGTANLDILKNQGGGSFTLYATYPLSIMGNSISGADFDLDGDIDLVLSSYWGTSNNVYVMLNNGNATFSGPGIYSAGSSAHGVAAKDVDNDGDVDLAVANTGNDNISVLLNDGTGVFGGLANYALGYSPYDLYGNDLDGDGDVDMAAVSYAANSIVTILNDGDGSFSGPVAYYTGSNSRDVVGGDVDGDGDIDLVASVNGADSVAVIMNDGGGTFGNLARYQVGNSPWGITTADFDGDGDLDVASANYNSDDLTVLRNVGGSLVLWGSTLGGQLVLNWTAYPGASAYWVYGADNNAYFEPGLSPGYLHRQAVLSPLFRTWSSSNGIGDPVHNWTYLVMAVNASEQELSRSNRFGEHDFDTGN